MTFLGSEATQLLVLATVPPKAVEFEGFTLLLLQCSSCFKHCLQLSSLFRVAGHLTGVSSTATYTRLA